MLDTIKAATTSVQGGSGGLLAEATFVMAEVRQVLATVDQDVYPKVSLISDIQ